MMTAVMPHVDAFPNALGGGILVHTALPVGDALHARLRAVIDDVDRALSRFRTDSTVARMAVAERGGRFRFPAWAAPLFDWADVLAAVTAGRVDPCAGADLVRLGYAASFEMIDSGGTSAAGGVGLRRARWGFDVHRDGGSVLVTDRAVQLDFGACGKGLCVDLLCTRLEEEFGADSPFVIDAGGDLRVHRLPEPLRIALEDPSDTDRAIGVAQLAEGALCASAPSRRYWRDALDRQVHHLLNAVTGEPVDDVAASWAAVPTRTFAALPTMVADGLATALFCAEPNTLTRDARVPRFDFAVLDSRCRLVHSRHFPAVFD